MTYGTGVSMKEKLAETHTCVLNLQIYMYYFNNKATLEHTGYKEKWSKLICNYPIPNLVPTLVMMLPPSDK